MTCAAVRPRRFVVTAPAPHGRRVRLDDVATEVGVSPATVSLVLRGIAGPSVATRERVLAAAARLGYRPDRAASALASRRSRTVGVLIDISNAYQARLVLDLYDAAERSGYSLILSTIRRSHDEGRAIETLLDSRCEALVLFGPEGSKRSLNELGNTLPVVVVGRAVPAASVDVVRTADDDGISAAVHHLAELGHRRIAYVGGPRGTVATLRRTGYETAMREVGLADFVEVVNGGDGESDGVRAAESIVNRGPRPSALITFNDRCAFGLIDALTRAGIEVPTAVSVIGFDDSPEAALLQISLTTVAQDTRALAENAMTSLVERLDLGRTSRREVIVAPHLVVRGTTSAYRP
jgi:DNA-binding LacI/PurR family transcriptional regulator